MGGVESRFNGLLVEGKQDEALHLWHSQAEIQTRYNPNQAIRGASHRGDTPIHSAARASMKIIMEELLSHGADPRVKNASGETPLHVVCSSTRFSSRTNHLRAELLTMLLDRLSPFSERSDSYEPIGNGVLVMTSSERDGGRQATDEPDPYRLALMDKNNNTPLHLAATSGLLSCVELLLAHNAPLFVYNIAGQTPCEVAGDAKQLIIAKLLESKMVLTGGLKEREKVVMSRARNRSFHSTGTLIKLREDIIQQVATDLQITDFSAQALLMAYSWSDILVKEAWSEDHVAACEKAGLDPATVRGQINHPTLISSLSTMECGICICGYSPEEMIQVPCSHHFCGDCWKQYLSGEIEEGHGREVRCPQHNCYKIVPNEMISQLVSEELYKKYTSLNLSKFVDTYSAVKWCPYPNCGSAVSVKKEEMGGAKDGRRGQSPAGAAAAVAAEVICLGYNVECCNGHGFCWYCMKEPHEPCDCKLWQRWTEIISTNGDVDGAIARLGQEAAANARWIVNFTKPCPHCKSPIQKNEGCNHMTCKTCNHDFCWVCLDPWHLHSHKTGGYFTCNRFKEQQSAREKVEKARRGMMDNYVKAAKETERIQRQKFDHYFTRYSNHLNSLEIELHLLQESQRKTAELARLGRVIEKKVAATRKKAGMEAITEETDSPSLPPPPSSSSSSSLAGVTQCPSSPSATRDQRNFLDDVIRVLLNARRVLSASYCIGYFLPEESQDLIRAHETLQGKLEEVVEMLSQVVNRAYLRTPQDQIQEMARNVDYTCEEYLNEMKEVARAAAIHSLRLFTKSTSPSSSSSASAAPLIAQRTRSSSSSSSASPPTLERLPRVHRPTPGRAHRTRTTSGIVDSLDLYRW